MYCRIAAAKVFYTRTKYAPHLYFTFEEKWLRAIGKEKNVYVFAYIYTAYACIA